VRKLFIFSIAALGLIGTPVLAADMAVKAPPPARPVPAPVYSWTGFYIGGNVGYSVGRNKATDLFAPANPGNTPPESFTLSPAGWLGGGQIGYNWQPTSNWVFGIEGDWQWTGQKDSVCIFACLVGAGPPPGQILGLTVDQQIRWLATLRGRVGYAQQGWLWYVTGGAAWAGLRENDTFFTGSTSLGTRQASGSLSDTRSGWTLGGGVETALVGNWSAKLEYLYVGLGDITNAFAFPNPPGATFFETVHTQVHDHIVRVGLNYRFGGDTIVAPTYGASAPIAPIYKAPPPPRPAPTVLAYSWTGLYVGGNFGYSVGRNRVGENAVNPFAIPTFAQSFTLSPAGWLGGIEVGYNWQTTPNWVVGVEADWQGTNQKDSVCLDECLIPGPFITVEQQIRWLATLRGRAGYAQQGWLWYVTGGGAWGSVRENDVLSDDSAVPPAVVSFSQTRSGWALGAGVETALAGNWSAKAEYLYVDLGTTTHTFGFTGSVAAATLTETINTRVRDNIFRLGLNYKFGALGVANY
jgi:outer membrane immunogenic protein